MLHVEESAYVKGFIILNDQMAVVGRANTLELARKFAAAPDLVAALEVTMKSLAAIVDSSDVVLTTELTECAEDAIADAETALAALKGKTDE